MEDGIELSAERPAPPGVLLRAAPWLLAGIALLLVAALQRIEPLFFLRDDNAVLFFPAYQHAYETLLAGELPLLNHHQMFGGTFLASGITGVFQVTLYPAALLLDLAGLDASLLVDLLAALHLALAALGAWALLRHQGVRPALAFPLALCWAFLPFTTVISRSWVFVTCLAAFLPWNQLLLSRFLAAPSARRGGLLLAVKLVYILSGYAQYVALTLVFEAIYTGVFLLLERTPQGRAPAARRRLPALAAIHLLALLLAAPLLAPMWNAKEASLARAQRIPPQIALQSAMTPGEFLEAQAWAPSALLLDAVPNTVYFLGPAWLLALGFGIFRFRRLGREGQAALAAGLAALAMSTALYYFLYLLPFFSTLRWPFKSFPIAAFFLLLVASRAAEDWVAAAPRRAALASLLAAVNLALQLAVLLPETWRSPFTPYLLDRPVAALRASPLLAAIGDQGRVALLASGEDPPSRGRAVELGFLFATLAGKYQIHGYDPLRARINVELGLKIPNDGQIRLREDSWLEVAARPPARYLLVDATSRLRRAIAATPAIRLLAVGDSMALYEAPHARPILSRMEDGRALPFAWRANGLELDLPPDFPGGRLLADVAGLAGYRWYLNGEPMGAPEIAFQRPLMAVPPGGGHLELRYTDAGFRLGLALCAAGLGLLLLLLRRGDAWLDGRQNR